MAKVPLIAKERFYYNGRNVEKDEQFDAEEQDVSLLTHSVSPRAALPEVEPQRVARKETEPEAEPEARTTRYRRRDVKAEDS